MLSPIEWENGDHKKGDTWTIQLIKDNSEKKLLNENMVLYDKKDVFTNVLSFNSHIKLHVFIVTCGNMYWK